MIKRPLCQPFLKLHEDSNDFQLPISLEQIRRKLDSKSYPTVSTWITDVESIWLTTLKGNPEGSPISLIALDVLQWFRKKLSLTGWTGREAELLCLFKAVKQLTNLADFPANFQ
jgi:hypothetical protein